VQDDAPKHKIRKSPTTPLVSHNQKEREAIPLRRNLWELRTIGFIHLTPQTRYAGISTNIESGSRGEREGKEVWASIPANTNCPTAAANPARKELKGYPPVKHAYTNCTAPTYIKKRRKASMMSRELDVFVRYDFQSSMVALERLEREKERERWVGDWVEGGLEGVEETADATSDLVFFDGIVQCWRS
jgi:hypothetical protein